MRLTAYIPIVSEKLKNKQLYPHVKILREGIPVKGYYNQFFCL